MTRGIRASSIRIESASSTRAKWYVPLRAAARLEGERVAQVVEARLLGGEVGDVAGVGPLPLGDGHPLLHEADRQPEPLVDRPHPGGVPPGEVVVEGEDVRAPAREGLQEDGRHRGERLPLAGGHLGDLPLREGEAGQDLLVERPLAEGAPGRLAGEGKGLGSLRVDRGPVLHSGAKGSGPLRQEGVGERRHRGLEGRHPGEHLPVGRQVVLDRATAKAIEKRGEAQAMQCTSRGNWRRPAAALTAYASSTWILRSSSRTSRASEC